MDTTTDLAKQNADVRRSAAVLAALVVDGTAAYVEAFSLTADGAGVTVYSRNVQRTQFAAEKLGLTYERDRQSRQHWWSGEHLDWPLRLVSFGDLPAPPEPLDALAVEAERAATL